MVADSSPAASGDRKGDVHPGPSPQPSSSTSEIDQRLVQLCAGRAFLSITGDRRQAVKRSRRLVLASGFDHPVSTGSRPLRHIPQLDGVIAVPPRLRGLTPSGANAIERTAPRSCRRWRSSFSWPCPITGSCYLPRLRGWLHPVKTLPNRLSTEFGGWRYSFWCPRPILGPYPVSRPRGFSHLAQTPPRRAHP